MIFSAVRIDPIYDALVKITQGLWQSGWTKESLLKGGGKERTLPTEVVRNEMFALLMKALQEESTRAGVSHLGAVRLATATDLFPRYVEVPQWVVFGLGSYFETPQGAYWPGIGAPSWLYLPRWKVWEQANPTQLDPCEDAMRNVVTDTFFNQVSAVSPKTALTKARTYSWSLFYFLAEAKTEELRRYFDELRRLPRDVAFDEDALLGCYIRAFELTEKDNLALVNPISWSKLAHEWYDFIHYTQLEASEAFIDAVKLLQLPPDEKKPRARIHD
jgi:hypothetical protein